DVSVGCQTLENKVDMDTLLVKADLGSVEVKNINLSRGHYVVADVGLGNMSLDYSGQPLVSNRDNGSVGFGNRSIILHNTTVPVLVNVRESWLCSLSIASSLKNIGNNTYANEAYQKNSANPLVFDLDVSMGNLIFKESR